MYILVSFNKFIHLCKHHPKVLITLKPDFLVSHPVNPLPCLAPVKHFFLYRLDLSFVEFHIHGVRMCSSGKFSFYSACFQSSSMYHVSICHSFLRLNTVPLFIHSPVDGYLGCFQFGVIMSKSAMNMQGTSGF